MEEINKETINQIIDSENYGYMELEQLREDIKEYIRMCKNKGYLITL